MTNLNGMSLSGRSVPVGYTVVSILSLVLLTGLWAYLWVH